MKFINYKMYDPDRPLGADAQLPTSVSPAAAAIRAAAAEMAFSKPLIVNVWRGVVAEAIVASVLGPEWTWCSGDYQAWDFERRDGVRLEVKQSAARQTWSRPGARSKSASFDIAYRQGRFDQWSDWIAERRRWADLYVFAYHPLSDEGADHRDPDQWMFYVVPTIALPEGKQIGLARVRSLAPACTVRQLAAAVALTSAALSRIGSHPGIAP